MRDTPIIADHKGNLIDSKAKVSQIADSRVDAKVDNRINHSTVKAVDKVGREMVHFEHYGTRERRNLLFRGGIPQLFFIPTSSEDERQSRDSTRSPVQSFG
ncbi:hypothetical protein TNCV_873161 [Trichonephila clavipes]|nr:hypothetical protein TNCV_873161 [Trichonephila clavipes]